MKNTVFLSWQADTSKKEGRNLIEKALELSFSRIAQDITIEKAVRELQVDKDTKDVPGSPPIFETILKKIDRAAIFVPDFTIVGTRRDGRPMPNPNVLIEYGYALKSLGRSQIVGVMNVAHGGPETLPFDLVHQRRPIMYNLPDGEADETRRAMREQLAKKLEGALRAVFESEEFSSKLPQISGPPPFVPREPLRGRARFRPPGEPIGVARPSLASLTGGDAVTVRLSDGPATWLRLAPMSSPGRTWKIAELEVARNLLVLVPLCEYGQHSGFVRGSDGIGVHAGAGDKPSPTLVYAFITGELWVINAWVLDHLPDRIILEENRFTASLEALTKFLGHLGIQGPYRWTAGMEGLKGRYLDGTNSPRLWGPCMVDVIEKEGIYNAGDSAAELLQPFFEEISDQCGAQRSSVA
jgi:hypothetical protein